MYVTECDGNVIVMLDQDQTIIYLNATVALDQSERIYPVAIVVLDQYQNTHLPTYRPT